MDDKIREIISSHGQLAVQTDSLADDADLYAAGMSSQASVSVMLALEDGFDVEFPDSMLRKSVFQSVAAIRSALSELGVEA